MRALLCRAFGPLSDLRVEDVPSPAPGPGEVKIRVEACGVNFLDALIVQGKYQVRPPLPFSPGGEIVGEVIAAGERVEHIKPGDVVAAAGVFGGFAEEAVVNARGVLKVSPELDRTLAAAAGIAYGTALHGLEDRGALQPGETLLVLGASGGVGLASVQVGKMLGARVVAAASTEDKRRLCIAHGADAVVDYTQADWREALKQAAPEGIDVVFDAVGGAFTEIAIRSLNWRGRHLVIGFAAGAIPAPPLNLLMLKGASSVGVFWGGLMQREPAKGAATMGRILSMVAERRLVPFVSATYPLERSVDALAAMLERRAIGKLVVTPG